MVFTSFVFLFAFLPLMLLGFYALRFYQQDFLAKVFLILGSLFFYGFWNPSLSCFIAWKHWSKFFDWKNNP
ncbi:hypothetical protein [Helicobacter sp. UBA3407]|uniref:hypothetical protein n=1 Tax=Helicobacter TaxID=209 RepID=UPI002604F20E|nr:hypothetical protein [Helicobacter sp. UBA3407]